MISGAIVRRQTTARPDPTAMTPFGGTGRSCGTATARMSIDGTVSDDSHERAR